MLVEQYETERQSGEEITTKSVAAKEKMTGKEGAVRDESEM